VPQPEQPARTPQRAATEHYDEEQIQPVLGCTCLAPALEHGKQSYEEKDYGQHGDALQQHGQLLRTALILPDVDTLGCQSAVMMVTGFYQTSDLSSFAATGQPMAAVPTCSSNPDGVADIPGTAAPAGADTSGTWSQWPRAGTYKKWTRGRSGFHECAGSGNISPLAQACVLHRHRSCSL